MKTRRKPWGLALFGVFVAHSVLAGYSSRVTILGYVQKIDRNWVTIIPRGPQPFEIPITWVKPEPGHSKIFVGSFVQVTANKDELLKKARRVERLPILSEGR